MALYRWVPNHYGMALNILHDLKKNKQEGWKSLMFQEYYFLNVYNEDWSLIISWNSKLLLHYNLLYKKRARLL